MSRVEDDPPAWKDGPPLWFLEAEDEQRWADVLQSHYDTLSKVRQLGLIATLSAQQFRPPRHPQVTLVSPNQPKFRMKLWETGVSFSYADGSGGRFSDSPRLAEDMFKLHRLVVEVAELLKRDILPPKSLFHENFLSDDTWERGEMDAPEGGYLGDGVWQTASGWEDLGR